MKRRVSIFLIISLLLSMMVPVSGANYVYSDTINKINGVEVFQQDVPHWMAHWQKGSGNVYLTHDSYSGHSAMLINSSDGADTTNFELSKDLGKDYIKAGGTYKITYMIKPLEETSIGYEIPDKVRYYDDYTKYTISVYDPETNEAVSGFYEKKWYRAEFEFVMPEKSAVTWYGLAFLSSSVFIVDDVKMYQMYNNEYRYIPEWYGVRNGSFEEVASGDYEKNEDGISYVYSDTIKKVSNVEVFREDAPHWMAKWQGGKATSYLTHDSYSGHSAMLINSSDGADTTNFELSKDKGKDYIKAGGTYKITYMIKPLEETSIGYEIPDKVRYYDDYTKYTISVYDPETDEAVSGFYEKKWYRAEIEFVMPEKSAVTWYGLAFLSSSVFIVDDVKMYQLYNGEYRYIPEVYGVRNGNFEEGVTGDYTVNENTGQDGNKNKYKDTTDIIDGVEVFKGEVPRWVSRWQDPGPSEIYLTHDSYSNHAAMLVKITDTADVTNKNLDKASGAEYVVTGGTYKVTYKIKPVLTANGTYEMEHHFRYYDKYTTIYTPKFYDIETGEQVTGNFESKWYSAEIDITDLPVKSTQQTYGLAFRSDSALFIVDDIKMYQLYNGEYRYIPENYAINNGDFEEGVTDDYIEEDVPEFKSILRETVGSEYLKLELDLNYSGEKGRKTAVGIEGDGGGKSIFGISGGKYNFGVTTEETAVQTGLHHVKVIVDCNKRTATVELTMPDGTSVKRSDPRYLGASALISAVNVYSNESGEVVENLKINVPDESDIPAEISGGDVKITEDGAVIRTRKNVPVTVDGISVDFNTPLLDKNVLDENVYLLKGSEKVRISDRKYEDGVYTLSPAGNLEADTEYTICVDENIGVGYASVFRTEKAVTVNVSELKKDGTSVNEIVQLESGDNTEVILDNAGYTGYTVFVAYYDNSGRLKATQQTDSNNMFEVGSLTNVREIRLFVWDTEDGMSSLSDCFILPYNAFEEDEVLNLVTTFYGDAGTTRGFAWTAMPEFTDMVIEYSEDGVLWNSIRKDATYTEYEGMLYYKADLSGLQPGEDYIYRIGDTEDDTWSEVCSFTTEDENAESFSFIGITDPQSTVWENGFEYLRMTLDAAMADSPDASFVVDLGDLVDDGTNREQWNNYFKASKGYVEGLPHMPVLGNHEARGDEVTAGKYFALHFNNPRNGADSLGNLTTADVSGEYTKGIINNIEQTVYSFEYGDAYFAVLNTGSDWNYDDSRIILEKQREWLKADASKSDKKWKILMLHQGLYPAMETRWDTRSILGDVIDECGIDLVLAGHDHAVTRTFPIKNGNIVSKTSGNVITKGEGTIYTILGSAGVKRYDEVPEAPEHAAVIEVTEANLPSYSVFNISEDKIEVVTKQINGAVIDKFEIS